MPRLTTPQCRARFAAAPVARLATVGDDGAPHLVPITFAVDGDAVYFAVDHKPKTTAALRRLANIAGHPQVCLLVDEYTPDWSRLWWVRADASAAVVTDAREGAAALDRLADRYPQYRDHRPTGPVVAVLVRRWTGWSATADT